MKHEGFTPGPWHIPTKAPFVAGCPNVAAADGKLIACTSDGKLWSREWDANARLIAAAPALLAENERLRDALDKIQYETEKVMRMRGWMEPDSGAEWFGPSCHFIQDTAKAALAGGRGEK